jgi:hypothetical protein
MGIVHLPEGTGLGPTLCRKIVERHGGTITSPDNPTDGTTFHIRLPVYQAPHVQNYESDKKDHALYYNIFGIVNLIYISVHHSA